MIGRLAIRPLLQLAVIYLPWCLSSTVQAQQSTLIKRIQDLDTQLIELSSNIHTDGSQRPQYRDMTNLIKKYDDLVANNFHHQAVSLLHLHSALLEQNFDHPHIFEIANFLLRQNEKAVVDKIRLRIVAENDHSLLASINLAFARYYAYRQEWSDCLRALTVQTASELSGELAEEAYLLRASALQQLSKHREAIDAYDRIPATSPHYLHARLNTAIASIRQGWLAEGNTIIKQIIPMATSAQDRTLADRIYLILGYAFLQQEYYRDARDAFRQIENSSRYVSRALLGIGLSASSQADYVGGLNALTLLKNSEKKDLPVAESYLVIPYLYEKLQDETIISASYSEAIEYYQARIVEIDSLVERDIGLQDIKLDDVAGSLHFDQIQLDYRPAYPDYFFSNYRKLLFLSKSLSTPSSQDKFQALTSHYQQTLDDIVDHLLEQRKHYLRSYLNQSRYGLARLYDQSAERKN